MKKIFKYQIPIARKIRLDFPVGGKILTFQMQNGIPTIWILIDDEKVSWTHFFSLYPTGEDTEIYSDNEYIGTVIDREFVWHLFHDRQVTYSFNTGR